MQSCRLSRVLVSILLLSACASCKKKENAAAAAAAASAQAANSKKWEEEFRKRDKAATERAANSVLPGTPDSVEKQLRRALLERLTKEPRAVPPKQVTPPDNIVPRWAYEYSIDGLGDVTLWRDNENDWAMHIKAVDESVFAPEGGLRVLVSSPPVRWWRVTAGPFDGAYLIRDPSGVEVRSAVATCTKGAPGLAPVLAECRR